MSYQSVDSLQKVLSDSVFHYAQDKKKAAGRALGTLVEIVTFYLLQAWNLRDSIAIERALPEFGDLEVTHNVEYSLHPQLKATSLQLQNIRAPITSQKIRTKLGIRGLGQDAILRQNVLLTGSGILRNSCVIATGPHSVWVAHLDGIEQEAYNVSVFELHNHPYAMLECKRVGVEDGMKKGPQSIEKAKQGAYVARSVSSLQKVRHKDGKVMGFLELPNGEVRISDYAEMLRSIVSSADDEVLRSFILTVGVVSNHGNWFTGEDHNKELKVLARSYDWLIFLTDQGLSRFIRDLLLEPLPDLHAARNAFLRSYGPECVANRFTKVQMDYEADQYLRHYFKANLPDIEGWFNVIAPQKMSIGGLRDELQQLDHKKWSEVWNL